MEGLLVLLVILLAVAALLREDAVLVVFYLLGGVYLVSLWWSKNSFKHIAVSRNFTSRAFYNQPVQVRISLQNRGWLPVVWLRIHESVPVELSNSTTVQAAVTLGPRGKTDITYTLAGRKRGYYRLGPVFLDSGDLLGLSRESRGQSAVDELIIYPRIYRLDRASLPSQSPFGTLRERRPIFEDPARVRGKRDYVTGDSLRRVDWKASAAQGRLQVKNYEPTIALTLFIALNLHPEDYEVNSRASSMETAVVTAASIAAWAVQHRQPVGFASNGRDPLGDGQAPHPLPPRAGSGALMQILDLLARIQPGETFPCADLLRRVGAELTWGTTLALVTGMLSADLLSEMFRLQRRGIQIFVTPIGPLPNQQAIHRRAQQFGIPVYPILHEQDLEVWQAGE